MRVLILHNANILNNSHNINFELINKGFEDYKDSKISSTLWGPGYNTYSSIRFDDIIKRNDAIIVVCSGDMSWLPIDTIALTKRRIKVGWLVDGGDNEQHATILNKIKFNLIYCLNSSCIDTSPLNNKRLNVLPQCIPVAIDRSNTEPQEYDIGCLIEDTKTKKEILNVVTATKKQYKIFKKSDVNTPDKLIKAVQNCKIFLHVLDNITSPNVFDIFNIVQCKTLYVCNYKDKLEDIFNTTTQIVVFHDLSDLHEKLQYYTIVDRARKSNIENAFTHLATNHTYAKRCETILQDIFLGDGST